VAEGDRQREEAYTLQAAAHNLGLILRKLLGSGKPREFAAGGWSFYVAQFATGTALRLVRGVPALRHRILAQVRPTITAA